VAAFSTTLTLMHEAPLPVLAVPNNHALDFAKAPFRMLIADDLLESTQEAARKAYEFAASLSSCHLRHVHVHGDLAERVRHLWQNLVGRAASALGEDITSEEEAVAAEFKARKERLTRQGYPFTSEPARRGVSVEIDMRSGAVESELSAAIKDSDADVVIFGRHRLLHTRPLLIGRMPFHAMLRANCGVLMVPPRAELYAAIPFPGAHT
jgi:nucleotide-binding universal stress UspA family protein